MIRTALVIIDPQNDFVLTDQDGAALPVPGAKADMDRLSDFIRKNITKFNEIQVTLDSHHQFQIFHPMYWTDGKGKQPKPFDRITADDIEKGVWTTKVPSHRQRALEYVKALETGGRYVLIIWPYHCLIGSWGGQIYEPLFKTLLDWETTNIGMFGKVTKGSNLFTEHYSAVKAEVPDPQDPTTQLNQDFIDILANPDIDQVLVAGEALDFCLYNSALDVANALGVDQAKKIKVLEDCTSPIYPDAVARVKADLGAKGVQFITTATAF